MTEKNAKKRRKNGRGKKTKKRKRQISPVHVMEATSLRPKDWSRVTADEEDGQDGEC